MSASWFFENLNFSYALILAIILALLELIVRRRFHSVIFLRCIWLGLLGFITLQLMFVNEAEWSQPQALKVFVDRSDSVALVPSRANRVHEFLKEIESWTKKREVPFQVYSFSDQVIDEGLSFSLGGLRTLLQPAEERLIDHQGSALVISDGLWSDTANFKVPTFSVNLGEDNEKDVWIENIQPVFTAFLKNRLKIPVTIGHSGFNGKSIKISLWLADQKIEEKSISLSQTRIETEFSYFPEKMGEQVFVVKITATDGELSLINNESPFRVRTVRDKIRLLHIGGKPSQDLKAWRLFLTHQPDVDLVSFYILRTLEDDPEAKNAELSLIPFPYEELFSTELEKFDVVILQNFDFSLYFPSFYLSNLARFIEKGGALLMMGGDQSFHRYARSPLEPLLPFVFDRGGAFEFDRQNVELVTKHPILKGIESAFQVVDWTARHGVSERSSQQTLMRFKNGIPFISLRDASKGRVVTINSDESWKLQSQPTGETPVFGRLARRIIQYLTFDPEVDAKVLQSSLWSTGQQVHLSLSSGERANWKIKSLAFKNFETHFQNVSGVDFEVPHAGAYLVEVEGILESKGFITEEQPWKNEWKNIISNAEGLKKLSKLSHGKYFDYEDRAQIFDQSLSGRQMISADIVPWSRANHNIAWLILILAILFFGLDLFVRKKVRWDA